MMDLETIDDKQKGGIGAKRAILDAEVLKRSKVLLVSEQPVVKFDRRCPPPEISIHVSVFNLRHGTFDSPAIYFVSSDTRLSEILIRVRKEFSIMQPRDSLESERAKYYLFYENIQLDENKRFAELGFVPGDKFFFCPKQYLPSQTTGALKSYVEFVLSQTQTPIDPVHDSQQTYFYMENNQFQLRPAYSQLCRMSFFELGNVQNFTVENKHGRIQFLEPVDLRHCNLSQVVCIEPNLIEVYPEGILKPKPSHGLNVRAHLFFYGLKSQKKTGDPETNAAEFETKLRKWVMGLEHAKFLKYDHRSFILQIEVEHF